jgi:hypothetical protein
MPSSTYEQEAASRNRLAASVAVRATGARFSSASAIVLAGAIGAALPTAYGSRERPLSDLFVEILFAAAIAAAVVGLVPLALALSPRRATLVALVVALASAGAGAIHFAVIRGHFDEYWLYGLFFIVTALIQLAWATAVIVRASDVLLVVGILVNAAIIGTWIVTRTFGLLIGPGADEAEPVGLADALATAFEVIIVVCGILALRGRARAVELPPGRAEALTWGLWLAAAGATTIGLLSAIGAASSVLPPSP